MPLEAVRGPVRRSLGVHLGIRMKPTDVVTPGRIRRGAYAVGRGIAESGAVVKGLDDMAKPTKKAPAKAKEFAFEKGDFVVYPTHGVGRVIDIEAKEIAGH